MSSFKFRYFGPCDLDIPREKWLNYFQIGETDQTPRSAASDLGLHSLLIILLGVSRLNWVRMASSEKPSASSRMGVHCYTSL